MGDAAAGRVLREGPCSQQHPYGGGVPGALLGTLTIGVLVFWEMLLCDPIHMSVHCAS